MVYSTENYNKKIMIIIIIIIIIPLQVQIVADATVFQDSTLAVADTCKMGLNSADCHRVGISFISLVSLKCLPVSLSPTVSVCRCPDVAGSLSLTLSSYYGQFVLFLVCILPVYSYHLSCLSYLKSIYFQLDKYLKLANGIDLVCTNFYDTFVDSSKGAKLAYYHYYYCYY